MSLRNVWLLGQYLVRVLPCLALIGTWLLGLAIAAGQHTLDETAFARQLALGEFATALADATAHLPADEKDQAFARIAHRQAEVGASQAAAQTILEIRSDLIQAQTLHQVFGTGNAPNQVGGGFGGMQPGGGSLADFDTLIELITTTVQPETWEEVGGTGTIAGFPSGVLIDAAGLMRPVAGLDASQKMSLDKSTGRDDLVRVSLPRLESALLERQARGLPPTDEMLTLGGIERVEYVLMDAEAHDVVLIGPQTANPDAISRGRLSDLAVAINSLRSGEGRMVCSITPRQKNLAATQAYLNESNRRPLRPGQRTTWLKNLQSRMGRQDIEFQGVASDTHTAHVLVAADYHMKLVGMGLRPSIPGVESYLDTVEVQPDGTLPPIDVLRWWFTLTKEPIVTDEDRTLFQMPESTVRVQSENEMLAEQGVRRPTGRSERLNRQFSDSFTRHFQELSDIYPIYRELRDVFDFSLVAALLVDEELPEIAGWQPTLLASMDAYVVPRMAVPLEVETIVSHRVVDDEHVIAGVSGGVDLAVRRDMSSFEIDSSRSYLFDTIGRDAKSTDRHASYEDTVRWRW